MGIVVLPTLRPFEFAFLIVVTLSVGMSFFYHNIWNNLYIGSLNYKSIKHQFFFYIHNARRIHHIKSEIVQ